MSENMNKAYAEVDEILQLLQSDFVERIPLKLREFFSKEKDEEYDVNINPNIPLENQKLLPETISILALLKLDYWCESEREKQELLELFNNNEIKYQYNLEERYSTENIFNNKKENTQLPAVVERTSIVDKILKFIHRIFGKHK